MTEEPTIPAGLTNEELEAEIVEELPDREAISLINANLATPVNTAVAADVLSDDSALPSAEQDAETDRTE